MDDDGISGRDWLRMFGILFGIGVAVVLGFIFISNALFKWGFIGGFIVIGAVLLLFAWIYDRRQARKDEEEWGAT
jgi:4-hydroxybenzoate polyprenyltransferase